MTNDEECLRIAKMNTRELFDLVMEDPTILTDPYYRELGSAVRKRYEALKEFGSIL